MLPLLVNSRLQPFQTRRTALGFFSLASLNSLISFRSFHLPPLFPKHRGRGIRQIKSLQSTTSRPFFPRVEDISGIPTFRGPAREPPTPRPIAPEGMQGSTAQTPNGSARLRSTARKEHGLRGSPKKKAAST